MPSGPSPDTERARGPMAAATRYDDALAEGLARWLTHHRGLVDPEVGTLSRPSAGYSAETVFADVTWADEHGQHLDRLVLRLAPREAATFADYDLVPQWQAQMAASRGRRPGARSGAARPTPAGSVRRSSSCPGWTATSSVPWPTSIPGCRGLAPSDRGRVFDGFLATLAAIHRADAAQGPRRTPPGQRGRAGLLGGVPRVVVPRLTRCRPWPRPSAGAGAPSRPTNRPPPSCGGTYGSRTS